MKLVRMRRPEALDICYSFILCRSPKGGGLLRLDLVSDTNWGSIVLLTSSFLLGTLLASFYRRRGQKYLLVWSVAWVVMSVHLLLTTLLGPAVPAWLAGIERSLLPISALVFYCAARLHARQTLAIRAVIAAAVAAGVWSFAQAYGYWNEPIGLLAGILFLAVARTFWEEGRRQESRAVALLGVTFAVWGLLSLLIAFRLRLNWLGGSRLLPLVFLPLLVTGILMVVIVCEEERRRIERNMLALSNLNLTTSTFVGGEIEKLFGQALDRVLDVVRIEAGALCVHSGGADGQTSVVVAGMGEAFSTAIQQDNLNETVASLVARQGGLVVFRDLARDKNWEALETEDSFRRLRQLLLGQGLETVIAISLQAKQRVFGVLLLGTPEDRNFSPAELRLLLGLGHQIALSIENSYLVQQTSRRSEELRILNEIGRALSSTLDLDTLLGRIYSEMLRVVDVRDFFIAFYDRDAGEVRFEIEVSEGKRLPKRTRPAGNDLVEHVVRTQQPLLIADHYDEQTRRLGFGPLGNVGSICAVPVILYDLSIGVLAVHSPKERAFDEGHVELLRVLASEAGIAIENARLFTEEQKKSRHLALINNVSNHAIATLNPDEMLARIATEIAKSLAYDHIGIAILDYSTKELVVQAEAGERRNAAGRRILLGEGLVGQVARTGQMAMVREATDTGPRTMLPDSLSSIALPVRYAEQLLGVLYVESSDRSEFPEPEILLLRTLADLFAGALHNALTFQKAREQAITDGLTGVKTHRFLMEALSAEWKRSTRATRPFALVLMDLDRFKFVNDFYGHLEGDIILERVGHILEQNCRRSDVVARYGGDEFVILMPETSVEQARQLASKLRGWVASDPLVRDKNITASFGIAGFPVDGSTPQELINVADSSMYVSKHHGGNSVSSAEQGDRNQRKRWKNDVLEAYLGVTLKRLFSTGPEAFDEVYRRLEQFIRSFGEQGGDGSDEVPLAVVETVTSLAAAIDAKDRSTQGHSQKVSSFAVMIAQALGMNPAEIEEIRMAALLHDIGKIAIPDLILNKSGPLDASEWETMKAHAELGAKILELLQPMNRIRDMVRHHHEFYDGTGYPDRLQGWQIPHGARVIAVADAYDTITSVRTYKKARTSEDAFAELERCARNQFDPEIVRIFIDTMRRAPHLMIEPGAGRSDRTVTPAPSVKV
jgi:diguanylate cyclase (GGDEF)-like protein/putative nucleotidyltransferase with HDIG domain